MSESDANGDSGPGRREVAHRLFATEYDAASLEYADSDEERAPKYVITPTGARVNRLFAVGVLTEVERVNEDVVRARVVDPTGAFVVYAGQYQPDALAFLERADPPMFVAVTGKANAFQPEDSDRVFTSIRPESIAEVDGETRDRWTVQAADHTLRRIGAFARALDTDGESGSETALVDPGFDPETENGIALAREEYGTTPTYLSILHETALEAARLVAGEVEEVAVPTAEPGEDGRRVAFADLRTARKTGMATEAAEAESNSEPADSTSASEPTAQESESEPATPDSVESMESDSEGAIADETPEPAGSSDDRPVETSAVDGDRIEDDSEPLGDFDTGDEPATAEADASEPEAEASNTAEGELYEFDAEERAEIEAEFDMEFSSGGEVDDPGEAGIDVPDGEAVETTAESAEPETETETETDLEVESEPETDEIEDGAINVEDRAMNVMRELANGDGAGWDAVVERVVSEHGVASEEVDDAIESALLSGRCYEPQDGVLKPI